MIGNQLNIDLFKKLEIKDTKNWFEIKNGQVEVKEFKLEQQGIDMLIGGTHSFTQNMDYKIKAKIPRELLRKSGVGQAADKGLDFLNKQAGKFGVNIAQGDFIDMDINILGSIASPKIKIKPTGSGGKSFKETAVDQIIDLKDKAIDEAKDKIKEETDKVKTDFVAKMNKEIDAVNKQLNPRIKKLEEDADAQVESLRKSKQKEIDKVKSEAYRQADLLVENAGNNLFKKKAAEIAAKKAKKVADKIAADSSSKIDGQVLKTRETAQKPIDKLKKQRDDKIIAIRKKYE